LLYHRRIIVFESVHLCERGGLGVWENASCGECAAWPPPYGEYTVLGLCGTRLMRRKSFRRNMDNWELISPTDHVLRDWTVPVNQTMFNIVEHVPEGALKIAMGGVNETLMAWQLRDYGYNCVVVGETLMRGSEMRMASGPYQSAYNEAKGLIKAFRSKGSVKYGPSSTASFYGKGEGAKETLGMMSH
jgi:hypothetical protein